MLTSSFFRFLAVGVINTLIGLGVIYATKWFLGAGDVIANMLGYAVGLTVSFFLNARFTFRYRGPIIPAVFRFILVFAVAYSTNLVTVLWLIHGTGLNSYWAQMMGIPPYTLTFYAGSLLVTFADRGDINQSKTLL